MSVAAPVGAATDNRFLTEALDADAHSRGAASWPGRRSSITALGDQSR